MTPGSYPVTVDSKIHGVNVSFSSGSYRELLSLCFIIIINCLCYVIVVKDVNTVGVMIDNNGILVVGELLLGVEGIETNS